MTKVFMSFAVRAALYRAPTIEEEISEKSSSKSLLFMSKYAGKY